jgi:dihydrodipicolinate synthase/N-acetylneuraminate lyase
VDLTQCRVALSGAMISVATPTTPTFELDLDAYRRNLEFMIGRGVDGENGVLLVAAAGGEFPMLSLEQRKELITASVEIVAGRVPVAASIQSNSTREAIALARHAREAGVAVGQLSSPYYYTPTPADIERFFADVAAEGGLPIMVYNNWWNTANMNLATVERLAEIEGVIALKWAAPSHPQYLEGYERLADRLVVVDNELQHVMAALMGATGFITHVSNFWPEYPIRLWELMKARELEALRDALAFKWAWRRWVERATHYTEGEGPFIKAALAEVGLGSGDPIPPSLPLTEQLRAELHELFVRFRVPSASEAAAAR